MIVVTSCNQPDAATLSKAAVKLLPFYNTADFTPVWPADSGYSKEAIHTIPAFSFTNQAGELVTEKTTEGKIYVADFFFTRCPGICPTLTKNLGIVQDSLKDDPGVLLLSHSVTPESDSTSVLQRYAKEHHVIAGKWHLLTGNRDSIYTIARQSYFADEDLGQQKDATDFLHTENMLLIDKHRRIRGIYKGTSATEMQNIVADIRVLEKEN
ncbi:MAG: SCO family protein [Chitinophagaceae bacterium]